MLAIVDLMKKVNSSVWAAKKTKPQKIESKSINLRLANKPSRSQNLDDFRYLYRQTKTLIFLSSGVLVLDLGKIVHFRRSGTQP